MTRAINVRGLCPAWASTNTPYTSGTSLKTDETSHPFTSLLKKITQWTLLAFIVRKAPLFRWAMAFAADDRCLGHTTAANEVLYFIRDTLRAQNPAKEQISRTAYYVAMCGVVRFLFLRFSFVDKI